MRGLVIGSEIYSHIHYATIIAKFLTLIPHVNSETVQAFKRRGIYSLNRTTDTSDIYIVYLRDFTYIYTNIYLYRCLRDLMNIIIILPFILYVLFDPNI